MPENGKRGMGHGEWGLETRDGSSKAKPMPWLRLRLLSTVIRERESVCVLDDRGKAFGGH